MLIIQSLKLGKVLRYPVTRHWYRLSHKKNYAIMLMVALSSEILCLESHFIRELTELRRMKFRPVLLGMM